MSDTTEDLSIFITQAAIEQILLISENDFTYEGQVFRLQISGKGCSGFEYNIGFTPVYDKDIAIKYPQGFSLTVDPFTAFYCKKGTLDYNFNPYDSEDGFLFTNDNEHLYEGKFFKDGDLVPNL